MTTLTSMMTATNLEVHPSKIHGNGVFATRPISPGQIIFSTTDFTILPQAAHGTVQRCPTEHVFEPDILRWVNHSCRRNAEVRFIGDEAQIASVAEMQPGEEVVCDYMCTEDSIPIPFRCNCGHCSGVMIG